MNPEEYLTKIEIDQLKAFNENVVLKNAIKKVLLDPIYNQGVLKEGLIPSRNFALTQAFNMLLQKRETWDYEKIGIDTMTNAKAIQLVEQGFGELEKFKVEKKEKSKKDNPAE